jgi:YggT family protein
MAIGRFLATFLNLYATVIFVYIVTSWFVRGARGPVRDIYNALATVCEPYLGLFRRVLPPVMLGSGGLDLSPLIGLFVLQIAANFVARLAV